MKITSTSKSLSFPTTTFGASNTPSEKNMKQHLILLVGHLLNQVSGDWSGTLSDDLCSRHCSENLPAEMQLAYFDPSRCFQRFSLMLIVACFTDFVEN